MNRLCLTLLFVSGVLPVVAQYKATCKPCRENPLLSKVFATRDSTFGGYFDRWSKVKPPRLRKDTIDRAIKSVFNLAMEYYHSHLEELASQKDYPPYFILYPYQHISIYPDSVFTYDRYQLPCQNYSLSNNLHPELYIKRFKRRFYQDSIGAMKAIQFNSSMFEELLCSLDSGMIYVLGKDEKKGSSNIASRICDPYMKKETLKTRLHFLSRRGFSPVTGMYSVFGVSLPHIDAIYFNPHLSKCVVKVYFDLSGFSIAMERRKSRWEIVLTAEHWVE